MTEDNAPAEKRRTYIQAAVAGVALTALMGGLLAVDVANRPELRVDCTVDVRDMDYGDDGDGTGGLANFGDPRVAEGWTREQLQEAKDAVMEEARGAEAERERCYGDDSFTI